MSDRLLKTQTEGVCPPIPAHCEGWTITKGNSLAKTELVPTARHPQAELQALQQNVIGIYKEQ